MPNFAATAFLPISRPEPIRPRTLILLRWIAISGQSAAVVAALMLKVLFDWRAVMAVITAAILFNLWLSLPTRTARPYVMRPIIQLGFDVIQVTALLALTGGLSNPFALFALAPVIIAATAMRRRETAILGGLTVLLLTVMAWQTWPLASAGGVALELPPLLIAGHWLALVIGAAFFAVYANRVATELAATATALSATQMALAREQKLQHLGGVVAAAAHEMGTPLATLKLVSTELGEEIAEALPDREDLINDIKIMGDSVNRCRDILRQMGNAGKDDLILHRAPLMTVLEEAVSPHDERGTIIITTDDDASGPEPVIARDPAVIHGLRNLVQNGVDFAHSQVEISAYWDESVISITINDDGPGYPPHFLTRIGEPFLTTRPEDGRKHYEGMGLGLFIAKTLLERTYARLGFTNQKKGAEVVVRWPRHAIERKSTGGLGQNPTIID